MTDQSRRNFVRWGAAALACGCGGAGSLAYAQGAVEARYVCPPCGCAMDGRVFDAPGRCPACNMTLIPQPAGAAEPSVLGQFEVPEDRNNPKTRRITLKYLRLPSTAAKAGAPIVFLSGGPGGAAIPLARGNYLPLFTALRAAADVILLDQRGTGASNAIPLCPPAEPSNLALTREGFTNWYRSELPRCWAFWNAQGVAINAYNTRESAADLEALRLHLGAAKIDLFGISYGTHLAQAAVKYHPGSIGRVALAGLEGLDQTVKRPARVDEVFQRIDALIGADPVARAAYPDLPGLMRRVHAKFYREPARVKFDMASGAPPREIAIDGFALQMAAGQFVRSAASLVDLPAFYRQLDKGDYSFLPLIFARGVGYPPIAGMPEAMDIASGISPARLALVEQEAKTAITGDALNFPMVQVRGLMPGLDLGEAFRAPMRTDVPALLIAGDVDGRTPLAEQREAGAQFANARWVVVENASHDVVLATPDLAPRLVRFFKGEAVPAQELLRNPTIKFSGV